MLMVLMMLAVVWFILWSQMQEEGHPAKMVGKLVVAYCIFAYVSGIFSGDNPSRSCDGGMGFTIVCEE